MQKIDTVLGDRQIIIVTRFIDQREDAIGNADRIKDQKHTAGFENDPFHVRFAGQAFTPVG